MTYILYTFNISYRHYMHINVGYYLAVPLNISFSHYSGCAFVSCSFRVR